MHRHQPSARTDQVAEYWTSGHGQRLKAGDQQVAVCTSCHRYEGKHAIYAVHDLKSPVYVTHVAETCSRCHADAKIMDGRQYHGQALGHQQYAEWKESVHGQALLKGDQSAPTCNNCHGNHGALPPEIGSVANTCGTCHGKVASLFANTQMKHKFDEVGLPGCATCHGKHRIQKPTDEMLGMGEGAKCGECHAQGKYGATLAGANYARSTRDGLDELRQLIKEEKEESAEVEKKGMEIGGPPFLTRDADDALTNARTLFHGFAPGPVNEALAKGKKAILDRKEWDEKALQDYTARRVWLGVSLVPIALVVLLLLIYIRRLPVPAATETDGGAGHGPGST